VTEIARWIVRTLLFGPAVALAAQSLDCNPPAGKLPYRAELVGKGANRAVNVTYQKRPSAAEATAAVKACLTVVVAQDGSVDALGSAWLGEAPIKLVDGKEHLAYIAKEKKIKPFGLDDALKSLKTK
jgi:hypothetical protein